jgi:drug/metabolite transporter (DMT)-like permease
MIAVVAGAAAALCWGISTVSGSRASKLIGAQATVAWMMAIGLLLALPLVALFSGAAALSAQSLALLAVGGAGNVGGLLLEYRALRIAPVGLVAPIASTEGAIAAVLAGVFGESLPGATMLLLAVIAAGVALAASAPRPAGAATTGRAVALAVAAAVVFGLGMYAQGRVSGDVPMVWTVVPARLLGVLLVAVPLVRRRRMTLRRAAVPFVLISGVGEVGGFLLFAAASRDQVAVAAVLSAQFAAFAAVGAYFALGERLAPVQRAGLVIIAVGVTALAALTA